MAPYQPGYGAMQQTTPKPKRPKRYLTTNQLGERWGGVDPRTINRWKKQGKIPAPTQMVPGSIYDMYDEDAIEAHERAAVANTRACNPPTAAANTRASKR
jgi:hypothetical protein